MINLDTLKDEVVSFVESANKKVLPSIIVASAISRVNDYTEEEAEELAKVNNFFCIKANKKQTDVVEINGVRFKKFETITDAIKAFYPSVMNVAGIFTADVALDSMSIGEKAKETLSKVIEDNSLTDIDTIFNILSSPIEAAKNELAEELQKPLDGISEAVSKVTEVVSDVVMNGGVQTLATVVSGRKFNTGDKIRLVKADLYAKPTSTAPSRIISGYYYIAAVKPTNNRYAIVAKPAYVSNKSYIIGYVRTAQMIKA